ncbi:hypothetical protein NEMIN01_0992 [Nematocida minor]|uniref:uncharacterized protein n=1 Tax=Nematocida minor TaxID=1912983 RepID=UPI0022202BF9|nr:uncharacterized protein NEMIN01_0992 [Nematocida minor]KAI5190368.1 hypothetical protein NEMIN01_0992 [Nematocida minor]
MKDIVCETEEQCYISRSIKQKLIKVFRNEALDEEEIRSLLRVRVVRPILRDYLMKNAEKYDIFKLLDAFLGE